MSHAYEVAALRILDHLHRAERELLQTVVVTFGGETGTVLALKLDEAHGLCFTMDAFIEPNLDGSMPQRFRRYYPVSTIKRKGL